MLYKCCGCGRQVSSVDGKMNKDGLFICTFCLEGHSDLYKEIVKLIEQVPTKRYGALNYVLAQELGLKLEVLKK